jgi:crotonobetainyl-CoA:carnitine CoA-transferase CaiB-like acyl-CoA transferase
MPYAALAELLKSAAVAASSRDRIEILGADPVFPTPFRVAAAGAAAIASCAIAADELWALRNSEPSTQRISIDLRHAAAGLRSPRYLRIDGAAPKDLFDPLSGLYRAREQRWIFLHCNFPHHRHAVLRALGLTEDAGRDGIASAVSEHDAAALEEAVHAAGGCAGMVRTTQQWAEHPQSAAVARLPLIEIERIGDAPREPLPPAARPLAGIRVLDLTRVLAGPTCARTLAEHGADVLKISGSHLPHSGPVEIDTGLGKLSAFLDLRQARERETLSGLIRDGRCDVFSQSYRPGSLAARGFGAQALAVLRPGIVCVELSAWGRTGPWKERRGFDTVVQSVSGMAVTQGGEATPRTLPVSAIDYVSGYLMAFGTMVALTRRAREGGSWHVRVSLARTGQWIVERGLLDPAIIRGVANELPDDYLASITTNTASPLGMIQHLAPVAQMSATPPRWQRPPVPLGHDAPVWPPRAA